jgi:SAM-dependent methyltransferase
METLETVSREGRDRLHPSLTNPSWLVLRQRREIFRRWLASLPAGPIDVLDVGGRIQPYRPLLEGRVRRYVAIDLLPTPLVNVQARGEQIPFRGGSFDLVICTQVLEYIPEPRVVIEEIRRVLKDGGWLVLSGPSVSPRDADHECWRFLPAGIRSLLSEFREVEVVPEGGTVTGFFRSINACFNIFSRYAVVRMVFRYTLFPAINLAGAALEAISGSRNDQFAANYSARARKWSGR